MLKIQKYLKHCLQGILTMVLMLTILPLQAHTVKPTASASKALIQSIFAPGLKPHAKDTILNRFMHAFDTSYHTKAMPPLPIWKKWTKKERAQFITLINNKARHTLSFILATKRPMHISINREHINLKTQVIVISAILHIQGQPPIPCAFYTHFKKTTIRIIDVQFFKSKLIETFLLEIRVFLYDHHNNWALLMKNLQHAPDPSLVKH